MTQDELDRLLRDWQVILGLRDWTIVAKRVHHNKMGPTHDGENEINDEQMWANISIGIRDEYDGEWHIESEEKSLVHELLHCHLNTVDKFKAGSLQAVMMERAINHIARALVNIRRGKYAAINPQAEGEIDVSGR